MADEHSFIEGDIIPGQRGQEIPAILQPGERVLPDPTITSPGPSWLDYAMVAGFVVFIVGMLVWVSLTG